MNRRETLKSLLLAPMASGVIASSATSKINAAEARTWKALPKDYSYGRTEIEKESDATLFAEDYFREHELLTIAVLCDIILPSDHPNGGALDAGLPDFVEFMAKDRERYQLPLRGGIAWLDSHSLERFSANFINISEPQRLIICDSIAYVDNQEAELQPGISFFSLIRNLTMTGYYTQYLGWSDRKCPDKARQVL
jgi:gluconate 2-dehydrogenase gamma chain